MKVRHWLLHAAGVLAGLLISLTWVGLTQLSGPSWGADVSFPLMVFFAAILTVAIRDVLIGEIG